MTQNNYGGENFEIQTGSNNINFMGGEHHHHYPSATPVGEPKHFQIPFSRNPYFTGRSELLTTLHETLGQTGAAALNQAKAIYGLGGVGKTQTAIEYAYRYFQDQPFYEWVLWVNASELTLAADFGAIASELALPNHETQKLEEKTAAVSRWLETHDRWLLIFDNADDPALLKPFRPRNPQGRILLTSRSQVFDQLEIAQPLAVQDMTAPEAREFLFRRTERSLDAETDATAADELAQELGYLPLALEQAGAYMRVKKLSFDKYLTAYRKRRLQLLEVQKPLTGDYPSSVATTWAINMEAVEQTTPAAAELLRFSAFLAPDNIPYELLERGGSQLGEVLAAALADAADDPLILPDLLSTLTRYSLIRLEDADRYSIHRMVQEVLRTAMDDSTKQGWIGQSHEALNQAFPSVEFETWGQCDRLVAHVQALAPQLQAFIDPPLSAARLLNQAGYYLHEQGRFSEVKPLYLQALAIRRQQLGDDHPAVATSLSNLAQLYQSQGYYSDAEPLCMQALAIFEKYFDSKHLLVATSLNNLAGLYELQGRYLEAEPLFEKALFIREEQLGSHHPEVAEILNNLAGLHESQGRYLQAEPLLERAISILESHLGANHPNLALSLNNQAQLYQLLGRYTEAEPLFERALSIREQHLSDRHPSVATSLDGLAQLRQSQGRYIEAETLFERALIIYKEQLGEDHPYVAACLNNLAKLYESQGQYPEAEPLRVQALAICEQRLGINHVDTATSLNNLAGLYDFTGRYGEAEQLFERSLSIRETHLGSDHPDVAISLNNLAGLYYSQGRYLEAEPLYLRALTILFNRLGETHPSFQTIWSNFIAFLRQVIQAGQTAQLSDHPTTQDVLKQLQEEAGKER